MVGNNDPGSLNVHIIESFASAGTAGFSIPFLNACMIPSGSYLFGRANGDLAHEIGHILGLSHTHQYSAWDWKCLTEPVSRTRTWPPLNLCPTRLISNVVCEATGDGLRDTQADNNLVNNNACFYNVTLNNDPWGDSYDNPPAGLQDRPDVHNIMSYNSATDCVDHFSRLQIAVMLWTLHFKKPNNFVGWSNPVSTFDDYEPDNESIIARTILLGESQERNFHQQWNKSVGYGYFTQCDVDWVRFIAPCSKNIEVFTSSIAGRTDADTRITLFNSSLTQLAQNDNISSSNHYSSLNWNFENGKEYFIRIENMSSNVTGYYTLTIGNPFTNSLSISGNNDLCQTSSYQINGLPAGASVLWSASPSNLVSFNCNSCLQPNITSIGTGKVTLNALAYATICDVEFSKEITKEIKVGYPDINNSAFLVSGPNCVNSGAVSFGVKYNGKSSCDLMSQGITEIEWNVFTNYPYTYQLTYNSGVYACTGVNNAGLRMTFSQPVTQPYIVTLLYRVKNACGWSQWSPGNYHFLNPCSGNKSFNVFPNPTNGNLQVSIENQEFIKIQPKIQEIYIMDKLGNIHKRYNYGNGISKAIIDISNLKADVYFIKLFDGKEWGIQTIIKK